MPLTILHTEASKGWGGQEIRILQESLRFKDLGHRVLIACQKESQMAVQAAKADIPVFIVQMRFALDPFAAANIIRIIISEKVDILHTHSSKDSWIAGIAGRLWGIPVIRSRHLSTPVKQSWYSTFVYRHLADAIITSGRHIRNALVEKNKLAPEKIISIPAGVDIERFDMNIDGEKIRNEFGLRDAFPVVGVVAILRSWKGHSYLLEAVPKVVSLYPAARFLIVGNGPQWDNLHKKIHHLKIEKNVIMTNFREDIPEIMAALDMFVLPSIASEATSQVIPQALAMGKPVIATNTGGLSEIIENGVTGLLIPPRDSEAISNAVIWMAKNSENAREMAVNGRNKIVKDYTFQKMIERTAEVYHYMLIKKGKVDDMNTPLA